MFVNTIIDNDIVQAESNAAAENFSGGYGYRGERILMTTDAVAGTDGVVGGIKVSQDGYIRVHDATGGMPSQYFSHGGLSVTSDGQLIITYTKPSTVYVRRGLPCDENGAVIANVATLLVENGELIEGSVSRASKAWDWDSDGLIKEYANNTAVIGYDPSDNSLRGLTIRKQWTNSLLDNRDLSTNWGGAATISANETGADGTANSAHTLTDDDGSAIELSQRVITISDDSNIHSALFLYKKTTGSTNRPGAKISLSGGSTIVQSQWTVNTNDGTLTARSNNAGTVSAKLFDFNDWWGIEVTAQNNSTGNTTLTYQILPAVASSDTGTWSSSETGSVIYDFGGVYLNESYAGPPIITGDSAVTREADDITDSSIPWFNADEGSVFVRLSLATTGHSPVPFEFSDGTKDNTVIVFESSGNWRFQVAATTSQANIDSGVSSTEAEQNISIAYKEDSFAISVGGASSQTDSSGSVASGINQLLIGNDTNAGNDLEGWIKDLSYYPVRLSNSQLESLSS